MPLHPFANVTKEGLTWVEWITLEILAVIYRSITQVEKVVFICSMNHLICQFNCTGRLVGTLRHSLRARSNKTAAASFTQAHFWHSQNLISKRPKYFLDKFILPKIDFMGKYPPKIDMGKLFFFSRAYLSHWFIFKITL